MRASKTLTKRQTIFLGALAGSMGALFISAVFLPGLGLNFPLPYLLLVVGLGAFVGTIGTVIAGNHAARRWIALAVAIFVGLLIPVCLIQIMFLLAGPD